jgi:hypothetical protein
MSQLTELLADAIRTRTAADAASRAVREHLCAKLRELIPPGTVIDLRQRKLPGYVVGLKLIGGNDRGTHLYRIDAVAAVDEDVNYPPLSYWECDATPLSEKTGEPMSARAGNNRGQRTTVRLRGAVSQMRDVSDAEMAQFLKDFSS